MPAGTAAAMALNGEIKPLTLENMQRVLLRGPFAGRCNEEFLPSAPLNGVCFSAWEAFAESAAQEPLLDGHRYMPTGVEIACAKDAEGLHYGFGTSCRTEKARETRGLFPAAAHDGGRAGGSCRGCDRRKLANRPAGDGTVTAPKLFYTNADAGSADQRGHGHSADRECSPGAMGRGKRRNPCVLPA